MSRSVSLAAYMALAGRGLREGYDPGPDRPEGPVIWGHAARGRSLPALAELGQRLIAQRPDLSMVLTAAEGIRPPARLKPGLIWAPAPPENTEAITRFLSHWRPSVGLWTSGHLRPALITHAGKTGLPLILVDAEEDAFDELRWRWLPAMGRSVMAPFHAMLTASEGAARRLRRLGVDPARIAITGPMLEGGTALPCDMGERESLARELGTRPVWLAARIQPDELETVTRAHRQANRYAHRLLLIVVPDDEDEGPALAAQLRREGWRLGVWSEGDVLREDTQILLADTRGEMGLWYRLAPITFMGSSLTPGHGGRNPFEPAALGSAILYGPNVSRHLDAYSRLAQAMGARIVRDADTLSAAVSQLTAPDRAAAMAHAAWTVATEGAEVTDRVLDLVQDLMDLRPEA
ncbi:3-deoxy-D-manno-octulosonic acid transferase [Pseudooceanicola sp. 502str34]|uniref:3-deoxy-D-manno-octulosonic acid transferase n=1 Tax=Maritimibacter alkaliphilus TaxID=404236 RepID=UPI001C9877CA|nr:glycosyltransferase N-terminal domain-containing protein [Maritimibacter alkaliphilus]MBY6092175.1 3-deoxy-D-manno-octulosonic acid transferase [Maritimibacter alkaliphilus]